jgi:glycerol-3-phosphate acyltransferase PlsY
VDPSTLLAGLLVLAGYLLGSLPMGVIVARLTGGRDPRTVGSGRTGGTNALRAMGPVPALAVGLLDIAKGALPVLGARLLGANALTEALVGSAAVLGASRSIFLGFHGGRGVATGIGAMAVIQPLVVLLGAPVFFGTIALTRYVSLASLLAAAAGGLLLTFFVAAGWNAPGSLVYGITAAALIWVAHADNIDRLLHGRERRLGVSEREPR